MHAVNRVIRQADVDTGRVTLDEILGLVDTNMSRAAHRGLTLIWQYKLGIYFGKVKKGDETIFSRSYHHRSTITALVYMQLDFRDFLDLGASKQQNGK